MYYNLRKTSGGQNITDCEVYYYSGFRNCLTLEYHFRINFLVAYNVAKTFGDRQDQFAKELDNLQTEFYDYISGSIERNKIKYSLPLGTDYKISEPIVSEIYKWFLPKQEAFAKKWGLYLNVD